MLRPATTRIEIFGFINLDWCDAVLRHQQSQGGDQQSPPDQAAEGVPRPPDGQGSLGGGAQDGLRGIDVDSSGTDGRGTLESAEARVPGGQWRSVRNIVFETWRDAVTHRDFALYRELFPPDFAPSATRNAFVALSERLADPKLRLTLGAVGQDENSATVECKIIGPSSIETLKLAFNKDGERFRLTGI